MRSEESLAPCAAEGGREPVILHDGKILDGRNRYKAAMTAGADVPTKDYEGTDPLGFVISLNLHRRHLNESQRAMVAARIVDMPGHRPDKGANLHTSAAAAGELLNVSERSVKAAKKVAAKAAPEIVEAVQQGKIAVSDAAKIADRPPEEQRAIMEKAQETSRNLVAAARRVDIEKQREEIEAGAVDLPAGVFEVISIDPPWPYRDGDLQALTLTEAGVIPAKERFALNRATAEACQAWVRSVTQP